MLEELWEFKNNLNDRGIFFCFNGPISQDLLVEMGDLLRQKLQLEDASRGTVIKVFSLIIEQAQNILHHSDEKLPSMDHETGELLNVGIIAVGYDGEHYFLLCGNKIEKSKVGPLQEILSRLQKMDKEELKQFYREKRRQEKHDDSPGAGLGFIEMARKASQPIEFKFIPVDEKYSFFSLKTVI